MLFTHLNIKIQISNWIMQLLSNVNSKQTLCWRTTDQCHKADIVCEFSCCRELNSALHRRKCNATSLVSNSQTHCRCSSCLRRINVTYSRHLVNEVDIKWLLCRTTARSNFRRATIAVSRAAYQWRKVLHSVPRRNENITGWHRLHIGIPLHLNRIPSSSCSCLYFAIIIFCQSADSLH